MSIEHKVAVLKQEVERLSGCVSKGHTWKIHEFHSADVGGGTFVSARRRCSVCKAVKSKEIPLTRRERRQLFEFLHGKD